MMKEKLLPDHKQQLKMQCGTSDQLKNSYRFRQLFMLSFFFLLSFASFLFANPTDTLKHELSATIPLDATFLTTDKLQQCYIVTSNNELLKYDQKGQLLFQYNNQRLGDITWVDATDPFHVLLFYQEYFTAIILDRTLNILGEYQLFDLNITDVNVVAMANDSNLWIFDETSGKLKMISQTGEIVEESQNTRLLLEKSIQPVNIVATNNRIYINAPESGILIFDNFGTYLKTLPITELADFQIIDNQLIYQKGTKLFSFHLKSLLTTEIQLPFQLEPKDQLKIQKGVLFLLKEKNLLIYKIF
ncbi:MAG: hypothetical protein AB8F74_05360 [Saprospiraceae bacterium]